MVETRRPSDTEVSEFVFMMTRATPQCRTLSREACACVKGAAKYVQRAGQTPLNVQAVHTLLYPSLASAGRYRESMVVKLISGEYVPKVVPRTDMVVPLMTKFDTTYASALSGELPRTIGCKTRTLAWYIAAYGRCVYPFVSGNRLVFLLVENHLRQSLGLPWRTRLVPQRAFRHFAENGFKRMCDSYLINEETLSAS
jgi:hypothetical protein